MCESSGVPSNSSTIADTSCSAQVSRKGYLQRFQSPLARHPCDSKSDATYIRKIAKIVIDNDDTPHFVLLCVLHLVPLSDAFFSNFYCYAKPNPTGSGPLVVSSRSDRPFHDKAEDAIIIFYLSYTYFDRYRIELGWVTLIVHRRALLTHIPAAHRACAPFCSTTEPAPALVDVPWSIWGPSATRLFKGIPTQMPWAETTAGQRAVTLLYRWPTPIIVQDFNPYAVCAARALASASGQSQQDDWSKELPNGNRMSLIVESSVFRANSIFGEDVWSSLPYVEVVTGDRYPYTGVMMDEERILGLQLQVHFESLCRWPVC